MPPIDKPCRMDTHPDSKPFQFCCKFNDWHKWYYFLMKSIHREKNCIDTAACKLPGSLFYYHIVLAEKSVCDKLPLRNMQFLCRSVHCIYSLRIEQRLAAKCHDRSDIISPCDITHDRCCHIAINMFSHIAMLLLGAMLTAACTGIGN